VRLASVELLLAYAFGKPREAVEMPVAQQTRPVIFGGRYMPSGELFAPHIPMPAPANGPPDPTPDSLGKRMVAVTAHLANAPRGFIGPDI
jgi:hypothetical protein